LKLLDLLSLWNELEDAFEASPQKGAVEGRDDDNLAPVGSLVRPFHNLFEGEFLNVALTSGKNCPSSIPITS